MKNHIAIIIFILGLSIPSFPAISQKIEIKDIFGRSLNDYQVTLVDWQGHLHNPYVKIILHAPANEAFPLTVELKATGSPRLMMDLPSTNDATGATKTVTFTNSNDIKEIKLVIAPDRNGKINGEYGIEKYILSLNYKDNQQTLPIIVIDQDDDLQPDFPVTVDFSPDDLTLAENEYLKKDGISLFATNPEVNADTKAARDAVEQAIKDWFYFFKDPGFDQVGVAEEQVDLPGGPKSFNDNRLIVKNKTSYSGFYVFIRTIYDGVLYENNSYGPVYSTGYPSGSGKYQSIKNVTLNANLPRSGALVIENVKKQKLLYTKLDNDDWNNADQGIVDDIYGLSIHEFGHTIVFEGGIKKIKEYKESNKKANLATGVNNYQGTVELDDSYHIVGADRLSGQTGGWGGLFPQRRWMITKLMLLFAEQAGWGLRTDLQPFMGTAITTSNPVLPSASEGESYKFQWKATGGVPFYDWRINPVELPQGLVLNRFTGEISGIPIIKNGKTVYEFTVGVKDYDEKSSYIDKKFSLKIEPGNKVTDADGNTYKTVQIDNQTWMAENLRTTKCSDGSSLTKTTTPQDWISIQKANPNTPAYNTYYFEKKQLAMPEVGYFYNTYAVTKEGCNVCPTGWHVPSQQDFIGLFNYLGGANKANLSLIDPQHWPQEANAANNASDFSALPTGGLAGIEYPPGKQYAYYNTAADKEGNPPYALFWGTTPRSTGGQYLFVIHPRDAGAFGVAGNTFGFSVRCLKDK